jgi:hypothetical protein
MGDGLEPMGRGDLRTTDGVNGALGPSTMLGSASLTTSRTGASVLPTASTATERRGYNKRVHKYRNYQTKPIFSGVQPWGKALARN